jgi:hypothetical protein
VLQQENMKDQQVLGQIKITMKIILAICILSLSVLNCHVKPDGKIENPSLKVESVVAQDDSLGLLRPFLMEDYGTVLKQRFRSLTTSDSAIVSSTFSILGQFDSARVFISDFDGFSFDSKDSRQCFDYEQLRGIKSSDKLLSLYYYYRNYYPKIDIECFEGVFAENFRFRDRRSEILDVLELWELGISDWPGILLAQESLDEILRLEKKFPYWYKPFILEAFHYEHQQQYEIAAKCFKNCLRFGKEQDLILSKIVRCYSDYTGKKDTAIIEDGKIYFKEIEILGFRNENRGDSILKYKKLRR